MPRCARSCCTRCVIWWRPASSQDAEAQRRSEMAKILLVEDNEMNRDMLARRLERRGYQVVIATDGDQGVRRAQAEAPDLILMDMSLPVLDGWEATRQLRAMPATQAIPIIALTAHAMAGDRGEALEAGWDDYPTQTNQVTGGFGEKLYHLGERGAGLDHAPGYPLRSGRHAD